jgi:hypothetical protein
VSKCRGKGVNVVRGGLEGSESGHESSFLLCNLDETEPYFKGLPATHVSILFEQILMWALDRCQVYCYLV